VRCVTRVVFTDAFAYCTVIKAILVLKYVLSGYTNMFMYYGYANLSQNILLMVSAAILWMAQSTSSEYEYNLTL